MSQGEREEATFEELATAYVATWAAMCLAVKHAAAIQGRESEPGEMTVWVTKVASKLGVPMRDLAFVCGDARVGKIMEKYLGGDDGTPAVGALEEQFKIPEGRANG